MEVWLVGGAVRDELLGLPVRERDWVVTGATPEMMRGRGYRPADREFPVFLHPQTGEEYALARRERKTGSGYRGFAVECGPDVSIAEDLARRDLTINAIARGADGRIVDPYGGQEDLRAGLLKHVTPAFVEDPLRVLRVARFAARFAPFGFRVAHGTHALMRQIVESGELAHLTRERVWEETARALAEGHPARYFEVLHACGAQAVLFPELDAAIPAASTHAPRPVPLPWAALEQGAARGGDTAVRFAALLAASGDAACAGTLSRLPVPAAVRDFCMFVCANDPRDAVADGAQARHALLERLDAWRRPERFAAWRVCGAALCAAGADAGCLDRLDRLGHAFEATRGITGATLAREGLSGVALGEALRERRIEAIGDG